MQANRSRYTVSELKRMKRQSQRAYSKVKRKVESLRKLREDIFELNRQTGFFKEELVNLTDPCYQPPVKSNGY